MRTVRTRFAGPDQIYPPFIEMYAVYMCQMNDMCLEHAVIPEHDEQVMIVKEMHMLSQTMDFSEVASSVFALLLTHNDETLSELLTLLYNYKLLESHITEIVGNVHATYMS